MYSYDNLIPTVRSGKTLATDHLDWAERQFNASFDRGCRFSSDARNILTAGGQRIYAQIAVMIQYWRPHISCPRENGEIWCHELAVYPKQWNSLGWLASWYNAEAWCKAHSPWYSKT